MIIASIAKYSTFGRSICNLKLHVFLDGIELELTGTSHIAGYEKMSAYHSAIFNHNYSINQTILRKSISYFLGIFEGWGISTLFVTLEKKDFSTTTCILLIKTIFKFVSMSITVKRREIL